MGGSDTAKALGGRREDLHLLPPEQLTVVTEKTHPLYDERVDLPVNEALVLNIMARGVVVPVFARRNGEALEVVDGRQRVRAAVEANRRLTAAGSPTINMRVKIVRGLEDRDLLGMMVALNELRTPDAKVVRARKMQRMIDYGCDMDTVRIAFGFSSEQTVRNHLAILDCAAPVVKAIETGQLPATVAPKLAKLSRDQQVARLTEMVASGATKGRALDKAIAGKKTNAADVVRMRGRKRLEAWRDALLSQGEGEMTREDEVAVVVLRYVLGEEVTSGAFDAIKMHHPDELLDEGTSG